MTTPDQRLLIRADRLWSGGLEASIAPGHLLIDHHRIVARGPDAVSAGGAEVVDLPGCTLIPGLIDMHGHARINQRTGRLAEQVRDEPVRYVLHAVENLRDDLRAGV